MMCNHPAPCRALGVTVTLLLLLAPVHAGIIHVPLDQPTIQAGIVAAGAGDTVLVAPGVYIETIDFLGKAIVVRAAGGGASVINGNKNGSVVTFQSGEGPGSRLEGLVITNGSGTPRGNGWYDGGGILCKNASSPTIVDNQVTLNKAFGYGGGIHCATGSAPILDANSVTKNEAEWGGGIQCHQASPIITGNVVEQNVAYHGGGLACMNHADPLVLESVFRNNDAQSHGGGLYADGFSSPSIRRNLISENEAFGGGGVFISNDFSADFDRNEVTSNVAHNGGGLYFLGNCTADITNNLIAMNHADSRGGGVYSDNCDLTVTNDTIIDNVALYEGGGYWADEANDVIRNTILWGNQSPSAPQLRLHHSFGTCVVDISHCIVAGGLAGTSTHVLSTLVWGAGMIDADPLFVDPLAGDDHLRFESPARDAGLETAPGLPATDFEGDPRAAGGAPDIGRDEFHLHLYLTGDATPGGTVRLKLTAAPGATPVGLWLAAGRLDVPLSGFLGDWFLAPPIVGPFVLGVIPAPSGVLVLPGVIPPAPVPPYEFHLQALVVDQLTNPVTLVVE